MPAAILLIWPQPVLGIFGDEFTQAATALRILVVGQMFHLLTGPSGYLLTMPRHEKPLNITLVLSLFCLILLLLILSPEYGATGAALAATTALVLNKLMCVFLAARNLQIPMLLVLAR